MEEDMARVQIVSAERRGDTVTVSGLVDSKPYTVDVWWSHLSKLPDRTARQTYCAQQLKAVADRDVPTQIDVTGDYTV